MPEPASELARFQDAFVQALAGDAARLAPWTERGPQTERRLSVYRNTLAKGCADALAAQFPSVLRVVGEAWLGDAAVCFARAHPPSRASLADYGEAFPDWLTGFPPAAELPYLPGLARIDWARRTALFAEDGPALSAADMARLEPDDYARVGAALHPSAQLLWFEDGVPALWAALQAQTPPDEAELAPEPGGLLLVRPHLAVEHRLLGRGAYAFLDACRIGRSLAEAGAAALAAEPGLALAAAFSDLISLGAFAGVTATRPSTYDDLKTAD